MLTTVCHMSAKHFAHVTFHSQKDALTYIRDEGWAEHCHVEIDGSLLIVCRDK